MKLREIRKKNAHNAGFTLLELVIVLAVIAILSAILIPTVHGCHFAREGDGCPPELPFGRPAIYALPPGRG